MTNEWLNEKTARDAADEFVSAKDDETGLRLMRDVLPPLVPVRELRAVEAERNKLRARVAELENELAFAKWMEAEADMQRSQSVHREFERGDELRCEESGMVTYGIHRKSPLMHGNVIEVHGDEALRDRILNALQSRPAPAPAPVAADAGLTNEECETLFDVWCAVTDGFNASLRAVISKYLELRSQPARSRVQVESKEIEARAVSPGDEVYVSGAWQRVRSVSNISSDRTMMDLDRGNGSRWGCVRRSHDLVLARSRVQVQDQAAAGEPDYWTRLEHQYVALHWTENAADELFAEARRMSAEARRRVEGEEAGK